MAHLLAEIRRSPLLWLLVLVSVVADRPRPQAEESHAAVRTLRRGDRAAGGIASRATESVAARSATWRRPAQRDARPT